MVWYPEFPSSGACLSHSAWRDRGRNNHRSPQGTKGQCGFRSGAASTRAHGAEYTTHCTLLSFPLGVSPPPAKLHPRPRSKTPPCVPCRWCAGADADGRSKEENCLQKPREAHQPSSHFIKEPYNTASELRKSVQLNRFNLMKNDTVYNCLFFFFPLKTESNLLFDWHNPGPRHQLISLKQALTHRMIQRRNEAKHTKMISTQHGS